MAYDFTSIMHPFKKPMSMKPYEDLSMKELGQLYLEIAAKGREQERTELEKTIECLDKFSVDGSMLGEAENSILNKADELLDLDFAEEIELKSDLDEGNNSNSNNDNNNNEQ